MADPRMLLIIVLMGGILVGLAAGRLAESMPG